MSKKVAVITGADGGMGREITLAVAKAGYKTIMICYTLEKGDKVRKEIMKQSGNDDIDILQADFSLLASVARVAETISAKYDAISLLMNNAGTMQTQLTVTADSVERTVSVNYLAPYLLTRKLLPLLHKGARIVNMVSCTYAIGKINFPDFFTQGREGRFLRIPIYGNTKLALLLFTLDLAKRTKERGICVNAADPGIVSTPIIKMHAWFDPLTDVFFRPFIRTPKQGAATAISLLLDEKNATKTATFNRSCKSVSISEKYHHHPIMKQLWNKSEQLLSAWL